MYASLRKMNGSFLGGLSGGTEMVSIPAQMAFQRRMSFGLS
jgi:hypothetical protein